MSDVVSKTALVQLNQHKLMLKISVLVGVAITTPQQAIGLQVQEAPLTEIANARIFFEDNADMPEFLAKFNDLILKQADAKKK